MSLQGKVVAITGASAGIGRATAREMARRGAHVGLIARGAERLEAARREVEEHGVRACVAPADVADPEQVERAAAQIESELGPIDVWVNNAMTTVFAFFEDITPEEFERATTVTYLGTVWGTRAALQRMLPRDRGTIVQVGSAIAYRGIPLQSAYSGAKQAVKGFHQSLRTELRNKGSKVHLTMVQLPGLNTPQFDHCRSKMPEHPMPLPPIYQPEVAADAVHWAAHHRRREVYVGLPSVYTILGNKVAPWLAEHYLARTAVRGQQLNGEPPGPRNKYGNLFEPDAGDPGPRGRFDRQAHRRSTQWWVTRHRRALATLGVAAAAGTLIERGR
jgi:short-subunit dehydrogenase